MVSNHGARQLDGVSATIDALEEIANIGTKSFTSMMAVSTFSRCLIGIFP